MWRSEVGKAVRKMISAATFSVTKFLFFSLKKFSSLYTTRNAENVSLTLVSKMSTCFVILKCEQFFPILARKKETYGKKYLSNGLISPEFM